MKVVSVPDSRMSSVPRPPAGLDDFTFWLIIVCAALALVDWLIGKARRQQIADIVTAAWNWVDDIRPEKTFSRIASSLRVLFFGDELTSRLRLGFLQVAGIIGSSGVVLGYIRSLPVYRLAPHEVGMSPHPLALSLLLSFPLGMAINFTTNLVLEVFGEAVSWKRLAAALVVLSVFIGALIVLAGTVVLFANWYEFNVRPLYERGTIVRHFVYIQDYGFMRFPAIKPLTVAAIGLTFTTSAAILMLLIGLVSLAWLAKLLGTLFVRPFALILQRLAESEKGVLTVVSIGGGIAVKVVEQTVKYLWPPP